jgi:DNA-binding ferritin-like protein
MAQSNSPAAGIWRPPARIGTGVSPSRRDDPAAALNQVLSEVIDAILDVRQALRRVPETQALHNELDQLLADLRTWAQLLADQDQALGVSPLASMASGASRTPRNPWHGAASDQEVRRIVGEHLDRLEHQLSVALAEQYGDQTQAALAEIQHGILAHRRALSDP